jgi:MinD-like ATPase involved in chromosome partitioning or flagellar assembly
LNRLATRLETSIFILNQHMPQAQLSPETVEKGLKARLALKIPFDPQQQRALAQGEPLALTESASPIGTSMTRFAEAIYQRVAAKT